MTRSEAQIAALVRLSAALQETWVRAQEAFEGDIADDLRGMATEVAAAIAARASRKVTS